MDPNPLAPISVFLNGPLFEAIKSWRFEEPFVSRILTEDIPQRIKYENAQIWAYRDVQNQIVGFSTLTICGDHDFFTGNRNHLYIPLLAVHPDARGRGFGKAIVDHLVSESAKTFAGVSDPSALPDFLFLDVYEQSLAAIILYKKCGFVVLGDTAFTDDLNGQKYFVMAKRISG